MLFALRPSPGAPSDFGLIWSIVQSSPRGPPQIPHTGPSRSTSLWIRFCFSRGFMLATGGFYRTLRCRALRQPPP